MRYGRLVFLCLLSAACAAAPPPGGAAVPEATLTPMVVSFPTRPPELRPSQAPTLTPATTATYIVVYSDATDPTFTPTPLVVNTPLSIMANVATGVAPTRPPAPTPIRVAPPPSADVAAAEQYCVDLINAERANAGLSALSADAALMNVARARVADMVARGYTGHYDPVTGESLGHSLVTAAGYQVAGENWYGTLSGPPSIVDIAMGWFMTDPPHYRNILSTRYTGVGVGIAFNGQQWLLVQNFGAP